MRPGTHYLNCGYKAPLLISAENACMDALIRNRNPMDIRPEDFFQPVDEVRQLFARITHTQAHQIAVIPSVSYGMASVLSAVTPKSNGKALTVSEEFPSGYFALEKWCRQHDQKLSAIAAPTSSEISWSDQLISTIDDSTSVVLISSIHWMSGIMYDLKAIGEACRKVGARFIVDGTQSVGALPIDCLEFHIDALVCAAYKWLLGPYSIGLMYVSEGLEKGTPIEESWMNRSNAARFSELTQYDPHYKMGAGKYNVGETSNFLLMPMLNASLSQILDWGVGTIPNYVNRLKQPLLHCLAELEPDKDISDRSPHLMGVHLPKSISPSKLQQALVKNQVSLSIRGEFMRVSIHLFNDEEDISALVACIQSSYK